jgi:hypothetical protein
MRPPSDYIDDLEIVLDDLDNRDSARGETILADAGTRPDWSWRTHLRGHQPLPFGGTILLMLALLLGIAPSARDGTALAVEVGVGARLARAGMLHAVYIEPSVPWATVSVDGRNLPRMPRYGGATALYLTTGRHQLQWRAAPFNPMTCALSQPANHADTCARDDVVDGATPGVIATVISFQPSLTALPTRRRNDLVVAIQSVLDEQTATETVQPGERYVSAAGSLPPALSAHEPAAAAPLVATLRLRLVSDLEGAQTCHIEYSESCEQSGQDCRFLCTWPETGASEAWQALAIVRGLWTFATPGGQPVVTDAPDGLAGAGTAVSLRLKWTGGRWLVALSYFQPGLPNPGSSLPAQLGGYPGCTWLETELDAQIFVAHTADPGQQLTWRVAAGPPGAAGCLAIGSSASDAAAGVGAPLIGAYLLQRFGVILAANEAAHQRWPYLPLASAGERQLAATLATTQFPRA